MEEKDKKLDMKELGRRFKQIRQQEGRQVVDLEVLLITVGCDAAAWGAGPGIVDEHVDPLVALVQLASELAHLVEVVEISKEVVGADRAGGVGGTLRVASDEHHLLVPLGELPGCFGADAAARSGDDDRASAHDH